MTRRQVKNRGFASMSRERNAELARRGGIASHAAGAAHEFTSEEAAAAGRKAHELGKAHQWTREKAREAGRKGGLARARNARRAGGGL